MNAAADIPSTTAESSKPARGRSRVIRRLSFAAGVGVCVLATAAYFAFNFPYSIGSTPRARTTRASMLAINAAIQSYRSETGTSPSSLQSLVPEYLPPDKPLKDGWKRDFYYESAPVDPSHPYVLRSAGADGLTGTPDDLDVWTMKR